MPNQPTNIRKKGKKWLKNQVFVSSTYTDLKKERMLVNEVLLKNGCVPAEMDYFTASSRPSWEMVKTLIRESDFFLLIVAGRYGSIKKDEAGNFVSFTEMEYNYAVALNKPIVAFLHDRLDDLASKNSERSEDGIRLLETFRKKVKNAGRTVSFWNNEVTLAEEISASIQKLKDEHLRGGWFRSDPEDNLEIVWPEIKDWRLTRIFKTRAEKNAESDILLERHNIKRLDGIAFGLRSFRSNRKKDILCCLNNGMNVRFLVMNPRGRFIRQRECEEHTHAGTISKSIEDLEKWVAELNAESIDGKIAMKYYDCMTMDFYWRIDDVLYVGPYWVASESQATITYKFEAGGQGFKRYVEYFETLWNNCEFCHDGY